MQTQARLPGQSSFNQKRMASKKRKAEIITLDSSEDEDNKIQFGSSNQKEPTDTGWSLPETQLQAPTAATDNLSELPFEYANPRIQLTCVEELDRKDNIGCCTIEDCLNGRSGETSEKRDLPKLIKTLQFNYKLNADWFLPKLPKSAVEVTIIHGTKAYRSSEQIIDGRRITLILPDLPPFGTHHTKMMINFYDDDTLKVIIHTANLVAPDWTCKTQGTYTTPFLKMKNKGPADPSSDFERDLINYLRAYKNFHIDGWVERIQQYDFTCCRAIIVGSVPGSHADRDYHSWGLNRMKSLLERYVDLTKCYPPHVQGKEHLISQFSSWGSLGTNDEWLRGFFLNNMSKFKSAAPNLKNRKPEEHLCFPTVENVRDSIEGWEAGGSLPLSYDNCLKMQDYLPKYMASWVARDAGRDFAMPHIKTYTRLLIPESQSPSSQLPETNAFVAWILLTSANLSKAAWGQLINKGNTLKILSYELGVLIVPSLFKTEKHDDVYLVNTNVRLSRKQPFTPIDLDDVPLYSFPSSVSKIPSNFFSSRSPHKHSNPRQEDEDSRENGSPKLIVPIRLPYDLPMTKYKPNEECWCWDVDYDGYGFDRRGHLNRRG
ncbi:tyrosyl-DNA phosphodiesterase-domain-containing protein [Paraphysoderma sedebokerense]|nr:tyrosyl-DNA phosphodiesterase-domain-containing protein [Paraphysoderma sedebokerense]